MIPGNLLGLRGVIVGGIPALLDTEAAGPKQRIWLLMGL